MPLQHSDAEEDQGGGASLAPQVAPGEHYEDSSASSSEKRPTGKVVGIIRRNWRTRGYSGSLQPDRVGRPPKQGPSSVLFCPVERRYPFIRIQTRQVSLPSDYFSHRLPLPAAALATKPQSLRSP